MPIRSSQAYYPALPQKLRNAEDDPAGEERPNYVQISDRREESTGWTLSARLDEAGFVSEEGHQLREYNSYSTTSAWQRQVRIHPAPQPTGKAVN